MPERQSRFQWVVRFTKVWTILAFLMLIVAFVAVTLLLFVATENEQVSRITAIYKPTHRANLLLKKFAPGGSTLMPALRGRNL